MRLAYFVLGLLVGLLIGVSISYLKPEKVIVKKEREIVYVGGFIREIKFPVVAVTSKGQGVLEYAILKLLPGSGKLYVKLNPFVEPDTQYSFEEAVKAACKLAKIDCSKYDFILEFNTNATLVGGPSAGSAIALATYALLKNETLPNNFAITGTIDENGNIGPVGGIFEKALAAAKNNKTIFFIPYGQGIVYRYEKIEKKYEPFPGFVIYHVEYKPVPLNISEYFWSKYKMRIIEVKNLEEVIKILKL